LKLWTGARPSIQRELWHSNLNPEITSWGDVLTAAEVVEIAEGVTDFKQPNNNKKNNNSNDHSNNTARPNSWKGVLSRIPSNVTTTSTHSNGANNRRSFSKCGRNRSQSDHPSPPKIVQVLLLSPRPKSSNHGRESVPLSEKEWAELAAENKCFTCKEVGHMSRNCPNRNSVRGNSKKPPGMTNFNIEMVTKREDSDELMEIHDEITMSAIGLPAENWCKVYPQWNQDHISACRQLGDCYAMVVEALLTKEQPYPGDDKYIYSKRILPYTRLEIT
jgi:hypothetical protein